MIFGIETTRTATETKTSVISWSDQFRVKAAAWFVLEGPTDGTVQRELYEADTNDMTTRIYERLGQMRKERPAATWDEAVAAVVRAEGRKVNAGA